MLCEKEGTIMVPWPGWRGKTVHYTELPDVPPDSPLFQESTTYRRELPRLLAEGHEGKFVLIKGSEIIGLFDTSDEAYAILLQRFGYCDCFIQQIRTYEPLFRTRAV
jgi:hypothetical protein